MVRLSLAVLAATTALCTTAHAATVQALFSDQTKDQVLFAKDLNGDGDTNDPGEVTVFFDGNNGSGLTAPTRNVFQLVQSKAGDVYVGDGTSDTVYRLRDRNGDNNAQGAGEASVWFSANNAGGLPLQTANGVAEGPDGAIYIVQADTKGKPTRDVVYRTQDLNGDGDANDPGEATVWLDLTALSSSSSPFEISFDKGVAYIADTSGGSPRIYRAEDKDGDGKVDASEVRQFVQAKDKIFALSVEASNGNLFSYDFFKDALVRYTDLNGNGVIDIDTERFVAWDASKIIDGAVFDFSIKGNRGFVTVNDFNNNDKLFSLVDLNGDGDFMDPGEYSAFLTFSEQGTYPLRPRSIISYQSVAPVPLPASAVLLAGALGALGLRRRKTQSA